MELQATLFQSPSSLGHQASSRALDSMPRVRVRFYEAAQEEPRGKGYHEDEIPGFARLLVIVYRVLMVFHSVLYVFIVFCLLFWCFLFSGALTKTPLPFLFVIFFLGF